VTPLVQIPSDPAPQPSPTPSDRRGTSNFVQEEASLRRGIPLQRLLAGGMRYADAIALHSAADSGIEWADAGAWLGDRNLRLAQAASSAESQRDCLRFASACLRFGQLSLVRDTDRKKQLSHRKTQSFAEAASLDRPVTERHEIEWRQGRLCGWLMRPSIISARSVVIIIGGFDGWCEEHYLAATQLVGRGMSVLLLDGPGQGDSRLFHDLYFDRDFYEAFSTAATHLRTRCAMDRVGIWGNSLGGCLAAKTAALDHQFDALCVNGGTARPLDLPERHPRFFDKIEAFVGTSDRVRLLAIMQALDLHLDSAEIRCPLLQLHGVPDSVFKLGDARVIHDRALSTDKTLMLWDDGDHCLYNHWEERNMCAADWFAARLGNKPIHAN